MKRCSLAAYTQKRVVGWLESKQKMNGSLYVLHFPHSMVARNEMSPGFFIFYLGSTEGEPFNFFVTKPFLIQCT